jgi:hypothetical protein
MTEDLLQLTLIESRYQPALSLNEVKMDNDILVFNTIKKDDTITSVLKELSSINTK